MLYDMSCERKTEIKQSIKRKAYEDDRKIQDNLIK